MERLAEWLRQKVAESSYRDVEAVTDVSRGTLERIAKNKLKESPDLVTLIGLTKLGKSLADLVEMAGFSLGLPPEDDDTVARLRAAAAYDPQLAEILEALQQANAQDRRAVLTYLRGASRNRQSDKPGE